MFYLHDLQILPEKYSYYRRFDQETRQATDCVICMTAIDLSQRSNDCMVSDYKYKEQISLTLALVS